MTGTEVDVETQAERIAARGREALVERMRTAYGDARAAHADLISLDDERIETMVQSAADRADGLQWRRALATVAADEFGMSTTEALSHPAVVRAQALVGAPSYEQSLAELMARPVPPPVAPAENGSAAASVARAADVDAPGAEAPDARVPEPEPPEPQPPLPEPLPDPEPEPEPVPGPMVAPAAVEPSEALAELETEAAAEPPGALAELETEAAAETDPLEERSHELEAVEADDVMLELLPEPDPVEYETEAYDVEADFVREQVPPAPVNPFAAQTAAQAAAVQSQDEEETEVVIPAIHLGGVANLPTKRDGLSVRLSADGLDIMEGDRDIIGRLVWDEIETLEVPNLRPRRRAKQLRSRLVVRTPHGDASFDVPEIAADDLRERVEPLMRLHGRH